MTSITSNFNTLPPPHNEGRRALPLGTLVRQSFQQPRGCGRRLGHADADTAAVAVTSSSAQEPACQGS